MTTREEKGVQILMIVYNIYKGPTLIRQVSKNFPQGLRIAGSKAYTESIELPKDVPLNCFQKEKCSVEIQVNIKTKFGVVPVKYKLSNSTQP